MTFKTGSINIEGFSDFPKYLATGLLLCIICILVLSSVSDDSDAEIGEEFTVDHIKYEITAEDTVNEVEVTGHDGSITEYNGVGTVTYNDKTYNVTSIGKGAFKNCTSLTSVIIHKNIRSIGNYAFENCTGLRELSAPISFDMSSSKVWKNVKNIEKVTFTLDGRNGHDYEYRSKSPWCMSKNSLTVVNFEKGITHIGDYFLYGCDKVTSVYIPDTVRTIGFSAFYSCSSLVSIELPESLTEIGGCAFCRCSKLSDITIPDNVRIIGDRAFHACKSLISVTIGEDVKWIGLSAFSQCKSMIELKIPSYIRSVDKGCFWGCSSLKIITVPISLNWGFDSGVWQDCTNIERVNFLRGNTVGYNYKDNSYTPWYMSRNSLTVVHFEKGITHIGDNLLSKCDKVKWVSIPNTVKSIGKSAFNKCSSITNITIPDSVKEIGKDAFKDCPGYNSMPLPDIDKMVGIGSIGIMSQRSSSGGDDQDVHIVGSRSSERS